MKTFSVVLAAVASLVLQTVTVAGFAPALTALFAYFVGISSGATRGVFFGSLIGLVEDGLGGGMIGPNLLGKGMIGMLSSFLSGGLFRWTPFLGMLSVFILTVMDGFIVFYTKGLYETFPAPPARALLTVLLQGALNALVGALIKPKGAD